MNDQAKHYLAAGENLMEAGHAAEAERAFRSAQNHLGTHEADYMAQVIVTQGKIIEALEAQLPAAIGRKGGEAKSERKAEAVRANGAKGGRPRIVAKSPEAALGHKKVVLDRMDWSGCYPLIGSGGTCLAVLSAVDMDKEGKPAVLAGRVSGKIHFDEDRQAWVPGGK